MSSSYKSKILAAMDRKTDIRNISIIAHIDHGKTTLADHLLAAGKLMSSKVAGEARALDFLEEEQKRGITIKTANISFVYESQDSLPHLINLVDTPGHVDFSGDVSQALRLVDGAIVVVDAVEGIMAQTEMVVRSAIQERVRPILFINKVDRLIEELKLPAEKIEERIATTASMFNNLLRGFGSSDLEKRWRVSFKNDSLLVGSAVHGWAVSASRAQSGSLVFSDILDAYGRQSQHELREKFGVADVLLSSVLRRIPSPVDITDWRVRQLLTRALPSLRGVECDDSSDLVASVGKLDLDPTGKVIAILRVFSGTLKRGDTVALVRPGASPVEHKILRVLLYRGQRTVNVQGVSSGNIAGVVGLTDVRPGDSLLSDPHFPAFQDIGYLQEPVVRVTLEPIRTSDIKPLLEFLDRQVVLDRSLSCQVHEGTGEITLSGLGELQLELVCGRIRRLGIELEVSDPIVAMVEQLKEKAILEGTDGETRCRIVVQTEYAQSDETLVETAQIDDRNNVLSIPVGVRDSEKEMLVSAFKASVRNGPRRGLPIRSAAITVVSFEISEPSHAAAGLVLPFVTRLFSDAILASDPYVAEPYYAFLVSSPTEHIGEILTILSRRHAEIERMDHKEFRTFLHGVLPVNSSFGLAHDLRSASNGFAFCQLRVAVCKPLIDRTAPDE